MRDFGAFDKHLVGQLLEPLPGCIADGEALGKRDLRTDLITRRYGWATEGDGDALLLVPSTRLIVDVYFRTTAAAVKVGDVNLAGIAPAHLDVHPLLSGPMQVAEQ